MSDIHISLYGTDPVPQGSKKAFVNPKTGRAILTDASKKLKPWREALAAAGIEQMKNQGSVLIGEGPVSVTVDFTFVRPQAHYGTGRNAGVLKTGSPLSKATQPDVDKLLRATFDALTGVAYRDDSQVGEVHATKRYGETPGVRILVRRCF